VVNLHVLQHDPVEDEGQVRAWARTRGCALSRTRLYGGDPFPPLDQVQGLLVLGGAMGVYDYGQHPWLYREKTFLLDCIDMGVGVLGICLGAQLIADVLGARVHRNPHPEIGWFPVRLTDEGRRAAALRGWPDCFTALHWHQDTFDLPASAVHVASSAGCTHQGLIMRERVVGLQFHLEYTEAQLRKRVADAAVDEMAPGMHVQAADAILGAAAQVALCGPLLFQLLDNLMGLAGRRVPMSGLAVSG